MPPIKLPPVPASAYNQDRPANALLISQVHMLERAVRAAGRRVVSANPKTEAEVAAWVRELNRALHNAVLELQRGDASIADDIPRLLAEVTEEQVRAAAASLVPDRRALVEVVAGGAS